MTMMMTTSTTTVRSHLLTHHCHEYCCCCRCCYCCYPVALLLRHCPRHRRSSTLQLSGPSRRPPAKRRRPVPCLDQRFEPRRGGRQPVGGVYTTTRALFVSGIIDRPILQRSVPNTNPHHQKQTIIVIRPVFACCYSSSKNAVNELFLCWHPTGTYDDPLAVALGQGHHRRRENVPGSGERLATLWWPSGACPRLLRLKDLRCDSLTFDSPNVPQLATKNGVSSALRVSANTSNTK